MSGRAYYNEIDAYAAQWLRNLIAEGLIPAGDVDERSIADVQPDDLRGYVQCHFFAGLGGWAYALRLAGWADDRPVWTGSCPCQPFSVAGKQAGFDDARHLWPQFRRLIAERRPAVVFGEQVAGASDWLGLVRGDLEAMDYAVGAIPLQAASADADHFRDRYWFVADRDEFQRWPEQQQRISEAERTWQQSLGHGEAGGGSGPVADCHGERSQIALSSETSHERPAVAGGCLRALEYGAGQGLFPAAHSGVHCLEESAGAWNGEIERPSVPHSAVVDPSGFGWGEGFTEAEFRRRGFTAAVASIHDRQYIECHDGKWRRLPPPRVRWLGNGIPARVAKLRAFGNAIDPRPASQIIGAYMDIRGGQP